MAILGLIVLLICVLLFTPLRYQVQASCKGTLPTLDADVVFSLFFHLVSGQVRYQNEQLHWNMRIAWKRLGSDGVEAVEETAEDAAEMLADQLMEEPQPEKEPPASSEEKSADRSAQGKPELEKEQKPEPEKEPTDGSKGKRADKAAESEGRSKAESSAKENAENLPLKPSDVRSQESTKKTAGFREKTEHIFEKIKYTFCRFCAKIKELLRKKEILMDFIKDDAHQAALLKGLKELKRLIFRLKPKKISADIHFGFEDPSHTGYALAGISMIYPMVGEQMNVCPDFEQKVLEGSLFVKGHVRARIFAALAWNMIINKNVRTLIRDIKNFSFDA